MFVVKICTLIEQLYFFVSRVIFMKETNPNVTASSKSLKKIHLNLKKKKKKKSGFMIASF